jgi:hypothetical protein
VTSLRCQDLHPSSALAGCSSRTHVPESLQKSPAVLLLPFPLVAIPTIVFFKHRIGLRNDQHEESQPCYQHAAVNERSHQMPAFPYAEHSEQHPNRPHSRTASHFSPWIRHQLRSLGLFARMTTKSVMFSRSGCWQQTVTKYSHPTTETSCFFTNSCRVVPVRDQAALRVRTSRQQCARKRSFLDETDARFLS